MVKGRVTLDLPEIKEFSPNIIRSVETTEIAHNVGKEAGFITRHVESPVKSAPEPFDARSLRRSARTAQLGIAVRPETKDRFWKIAQKLGVRSGEEVLEALLQNFEEHEKK